MAVVGADVSELRSTAKQLTQTADTLENSKRSLDTTVSNVSVWRGQDADRFRSTWESQWSGSLKGAAAALREAADILRRNADDQEKTSQAGGGSTNPDVWTDGHSQGRSPKSDEAPTTASGLWDRMKQVQHMKDSSGYYVEQVLGEDGKTRYIVYINGTDAADGQTKGSNIPAMLGQLDEAQVKALEKLIQPPGSEVMLVGYSQGGMDAQNIAKSGRLNVQQVVTYGSPVRTDLDVPATHLRAGGDPVPHSTSAVKGVSFIVALAATRNPQFALQVAQSTGPYGDSAVNVEAGLGKNNEYFKGDSGVNSLNPLDHHEKGYENVSQQYDASGGQPANASKFEGKVTGGRDINTDGSWD